MHDDTDYVRAGLAIISLIGVCLVKVILFLRPTANINYEKISIVEDNYHWEQSLNEELTDHRATAQEDY